MVQFGPFFPAPPQTLPPAPAGRGAAIAGPLPAALGNLAPGARISGVILALDAQGRQQLRTRQGVITLARHANLPIGARVLVALGGTRTRPEVNLIPLEPPPPAAGQATAQAAGAAAARPPLSHHWPGLDKLLGELASANIAKSAISTALPRPGAGLARGLLSFIAALRSGQMEQLLGKSIALDILKNSRLSPFAASVRGDMARLERFAFESGPGGWYGLFAPLIVGDQLRQLRFYIRREDDRNAGERDPRARRFIVEAEMDRLGPIQIDGLLGGGNLDLLLRSANRLPHAWQAELGALVAKMAMLCGITGEIKFQTCRLFPVAPLEEGLLGADQHGVTA